MRESPIFVGVVTLGAAPNRTAATEREPRLVEILTETSQLNVHAYAIEHATAYVYISRLCFATMYVPVANQLQLRQAPV